MRRVKKSHVSWTVWVLLSVAAFPVLAQSSSRGETTRLEVRSGGAIPPDFCQGAPFVSLDKILSHRDGYLNRRVQTHAVLRTTVKEYTRISLTEGSDISILTTLDEESSHYAERQHVPRAAFPSVVVDLFDKLRAIEGPDFKKDFYKSAYYRRDVMACGRLIGSPGNFFFALDEMHTEDSYLLPWKTTKKKR